MTRKRRLVHLVVDKDGDVVFAKFDHHETASPAEVQVNWPGLENSRGGFEVIRVQYFWPPKGKK